MAKFDNEFNAEIRRTVNSFNQKVRRAENRGEKGLPKYRSVRELKAQFTTKNDMKKEVSQLKKMLNNKQALQRHRTEDGTISNWEYDYIVKNLRATDKWLQREIDRARLRYKDYPEHLYAIRADVNRLIDEREVINRDLRKLTARELRTVSATIDNYKRRNIKISSGREYFMRNLDSLLTAKGVPRSQRKRMYEKLNKLTNDQFMELYKRHDVISEVMITIPSDPKNPLSSEEREELAKKAIEKKGKKDGEQYNPTSDLLDEFEASLDNYIEEAKTSSHEGEKMGNMTYEEWMALGK